MANVFRAFFDNSCKAGTCSISSGGIITGTVFEYDGVTIEFFGLGYIVSCGCCKRSVGVGGVPSLGGYGVTAGSQGKR